MPFGGDEVRHHSEAGQKGLTVELTTTARNKKSELWEFQSLSS